MHISKAANLFFSKDIVSSASSCIMNVNCDVKTGHLCLTNAALDSPVQVNPKKTNIYAIMPYAYFCDIIVSKKKTI